VRLASRSLTLPGSMKVEGSDTLVLNGNAFETLHSNGKQGVAFETHVRVLAEGGEVTAGRDEVVRVKNAQRCHFDRGHLFELQEC
jgi:alpha-L-fucosidase 2